MWLCIQREGQECVNTAREAGRGAWDGAWQVQEGEAAEGLEAQEEHNPVCL